MVARIVLWSLADSKTTIEELRRDLRDESVDAFAEVEGLRFKAWLSDPAGERWGSFYLFESLEAAEQPLPGNARAPDRQGAGPRRDLRPRGDDRGPSRRGDELSRLGLAFE